MKTKLLITVIALQVAWVIGTVAVQETKLARGVVVRLETAPVDPRDLLRGDYVILGYKISTLSGALFAAPPAKELPPGTPVYVRLAKRGEFHEAEAASLDPLEAEPEHPVLRGKTRWTWVAPGRTNSAVTVEYGLERYYVREGTGTPPRGKLTADVAIPTSGNAVIRQIYLDGKPYAEAMKNVAR